MSFWTFLRDQWRVALFYVMGDFLLTTVLVLAAAESGKPIPGDLVAYASVLALFALGAYLVLEYWIRRPFYRDVHARLSREMSISEGDVPLVAATEEQRLFGQLLSAYHAVYMRNLAALEERQRFFETFATRFAHQMKTPVTAIRLLEQEMRQAADKGGRSRRAERVEEGGSSHYSVEEALAGWSGDTLQREWMDQLAEEAARMEASIDAMMYTARLNSFSFDSHLEAVDVPVVLRDIVNQHKAEWIRRKIYPKLECPREHVWALTDKKWFAFIVEQIVRNALQYGHKLDEQGDHVACTFWLRVFDCGNEIQIDFTDEGIGIPERDVRHVFEPFYTGANGRMHSRATGMGLYLVREVVDKLGHRVSVRSKEGDGTTVTVRIARSDYYHPASMMSLS
ncbi:sensor histidine kinase [Alicyclobacillus pomorum]|uniref:sensor histidine kinase n=1 Tax=Alicyclobacillus pomorum TaxID=204470 RepID=UPI0003F50C1A|nr:sensor histidine kinase [Alicyclobacillus pomorum]